MKGDDGGCGREARRARDSERPCEKCAESKPESDQPPTPSRTPKAQPGSPLSLSSAFVSCVAGSEAGKAVLSSGDGGEEGNRAMKKASCPLLGRPVNGPSISESGGGVYISAWGLKRLPLPEKEAASLKAMGSLGGDWE